MFQQMVARLDVFECATSQMVPTVASRDLDYWVVFQMFADEMIPG